MDEREALVFMAAILSTLGEGSAPSGIVYTGLMSHMNLDQFLGIESFLIGQKLIEKEWDVLHLTDAGKEMVKKIDAATIEC